MSSFLLKSTVANAGNHFAFQIERLIHFWFWERIVSGVGLVGVSRWGRSPPEPENYLKFANELLKIEKYLFQNSFQNVLKNQR